MGKTDSGKTTTILRFLGEEFESVKIGNIPKYLTKELKNPKHAMF